MSSMWRRACVCVRSVERTHVCVRREDLTPFFLFIKDLSRRLKVKYLNISQKYDMYIYIYIMRSYGV